MYPEPDFGSPLGASDARIASSTGEPGPTDRASLEIITGRIEGDAEQSKVFAVVRDQGGRAKQHVQAITTKRGEALRSLRRKSTRAISRSLPPTEGATSRQAG
jgi:hypothetical protein